MIMASILFCRFKITASTTKKKKALPTAGKQRAFAILVKETTNPDSWKAKWARKASRFQLLAIYSIARYSSQLHHLSDLEYEEKRE
jgi:hypothetical protein